VRWKRISWSTKWLQCKLAVNLLSIISLGLVKASILVFYMNIFTVRPFRIASQVMLGIVISWTISFFLANLLQCIPVTPLIEPFYENNCINGLPIWYGMAISDVIMDFMILIMPIPIVFHLQVPMKQRFGIIGIFLLGAT
jgi:hypothetical protein